jgi:hypothetical protein
VVKRLIINIIPAISIIISPELVGVSGILYSYAGFG